eukprot:3860435-Prymnesium_polylepis.1
MIRRRASPVSSLCARVTTDSVRFGPRGRARPGVSACRASGGRVCEGCVCVHIGLVQVRDG